MIDFHVPGVPKGKGSWKPIVNKVTRKVSMLPPKGMEQWASDVKRYAEAAAFGTSPAEGGVQVRMVFVLPRPKGHYGTGKNARRLKPSAPPAPIGKRDDIDKLARCVLDALTGVVYHDDGQVAALGVRKRYVEVAEGPGLYVQVRQEV